jgi:phenylalanyl-tRNA synthetase alpha chain
MTDLSNLEAELSARVAAAADVAALEAVRVEALGKSGSISELLKTLGRMTPDERREQGPKINGLRDAVATAIAEKKAALEAAELDARLAAERVDLSLPPAPQRKRPGAPDDAGHGRDDRRLRRHGLRVAEGPDIEDDFHNFTALNFPPKHPAREMHDTFWLPEDGTASASSCAPTPARCRSAPCCRARTRSCPPGSPPARRRRSASSCPAAPIAKDSDATHTPMFHQIEGLVIDRNIHMGHLKWTLDTFIARFFETPVVETRFRPHHFPFTEPSAEMDVKCDRSGGDVKIGQGNDWLEILGCGMVHPNVLRTAASIPTSGRASPSASASTVWAR